MKPELKNPGFLAAGIAIIAICTLLMHLLRIRRDRKYSNGTRTSATDLVRSLPLYHRLDVIRKILTILTETALIGSLIAALFLAARPYTVDSQRNGVKKRDIFLCLDVSYSIYGLNRDLTEYLQQVVGSLKGDRFGVTIFNTSSVLYVPLTDDYDFVIQRLKEMEEYFDAQQIYMEDENLAYYNNDDFNALMDTLNYFDAGTLMNNNIRGSSLIGEGLATCLYSFPSIGDEERTRVIIMTTDNAENALRTPLVELDEAAYLCEKNDVTVFGLFPGRETYRDDLTDIPYDYAARGFKNSVEKTGGKFYVWDTAHPASEIVQDIQKQEAMAVDEIVITRAIDQPELPYIFLFLGLSVACASYLALRR